MKTELELALEIIAAHGYAAVKKEPEVKKFTPFKGQIVQSDYGDCYRFSRIEGGLYVAYSTCSIDYCHASCNPIQGLVQFQPWSELGNYIGQANVLFDDKKIEWYINPRNAVYKGLNPVGFQKLDD